MMVMMIGMIMLVTKVMVFIVKMAMDGGDVSFCFHNFDNFVSSDRSSRSSAP